jgi:uncharacterized protein YndB with AHSA1/START domain
MEKFDLEYLFKASNKIIYNCLTTPSGLSEWFADDVNVRDGIYTFMWEGSEEKAKLLAKKKDEFVRFQWMDEYDEGLKTYFEMRIQIDPLTKEVALIVTDFAEEDEIEDATLLWDSQIDALKQAIGS